MIDDCNGGDDSHPIIPSRYRGQLETTLEPIDNLKFKLKLHDFLKLNNKLINSAPCVPDFGSKNI